MINIIAAVSANGAIGKDGAVPWDIPEDRAYFRRLTTGNICIMGRVTYESIGRPLPDRINIVISSQKKFTADNLRTVSSFDEALKLAESCVKLSGRDMEIFICGGERLYSEGLPLAHRLYLTELDGVYNGDAFFPEFDRNIFKLKHRERKEELALSFSVYERNNS
ncbi:MAG: dihydrofolate reductase [Ruminococcus sp.]|nr:dihydrofolate reductase [Ruminococcus sp.]